MKVIGLMLLFILVSFPVLADSRSATIRVSCTILPTLEISLPQKNGQTLVLWPLVGTNLGKNYSVSKILLKKPEGTLKLYSVTAL